MLSLRRVPVLGRCCLPLLVFQEDQGLGIYGEKTKRGPKLISVDASIGISLSVRFLNPPGISLGYTSWTLGISLPPYCENLVRSSAMVLMVGVFVNRGVTAPVGVL